MIRITSKKDGFRRCGIAHTLAAIDYPNDQFSEEQIKQLLTEPNLVVEVFDDEGEQINLVVSLDTSKPDVGAIHNELLDLRQQFDQVNEELTQKRDVNAALSAENDQLARDLAAVQEENKRNIEVLEAVKFDRENLLKENNELLNKVAALEKAATKGKK